MKILIACEESQAVTIEMRKLGHEAYSCDIEECSGDHKEWHINQDVLPLLNGNCIFNTSDGKKHEIIGKWDMVIAFPPCTYLSNAGARHLYKNGELNQERYKKGVEAKEFFMKIYNADCEKIAIENPIHSKVFDIISYSQQIQPYEFGHPVTKKTRLWLKGLPKLNQTNVIKPISTFLPSGTGRKKGESTFGYERSKKSKARSKTFPGIAKAMAEQWGIE